MQSHLVARSEKEYDNTKIVVINGGTPSLTRWPALPKIASSECGWSTRRAGTRIYNKLLACYDNEVWSFWIKTIQAMTIIDRISRKFPGQKMEKEPIS